MTVIKKEFLNKEIFDEEFIKKIANQHPDGVELIEFIKSNQQDLMQLHKIREGFSLLGEELDMYCDLCSIINSSEFWYSDFITNCKNIVQSHNIFNSERVFDSCAVHDSMDVVSSEKVSKSYQVFYSSLVSLSDKIYDCTNITDGHNICKSKAIVKGKNIYGSKNVFQSSEILDSINIHNSYFCSKSKNLKNCMFCHEIENGEYQIFNKPIDKDFFQVFLEQYKNYNNLELNFISLWPKNLALKMSNAPNPNPSKWFNQLPYDFWKWVRTLPEFDELLLYKITLNPLSLIE